MSEKHLVCIWYMAFDCVDTILRQMKLIGCLHVPMDVWRLMTLNIHPGVGEGNSYRQISTKSSP